VLTRRPTICPDVCCLDGFSLKLLHIHVPKPSEYCGLAYSHEEEKEVCAIFSVGFIDSELI